MRRTVLFLCLALTGCAGFGTLETGLKAMKGQPLSALTAKIGYPNSEGTIAGEKYYVWTNNVMLPDGPTMQTGSGMAGGTPFNYSQTTYGGGYSPSGCYIRLFVDKNEIITHGDYHGSLGACDFYIQRLKPQ